MFPSMKHTPFAPFDPPAFLRPTARSARLGRKGIVTAGKSEADYFNVCAVCGQAFDTRDSSEVLRHGLGPHDPQPTN
jgi:hypothetical protein